MVSATAISFLDGADLNEGENPNPLTSTVERRALSLQALDLAHIRPHGHGAADGVDVVVADQYIEIGTVRADRLEPGCIDLRASLPPAVAATDDPWIQRFVEPRPGAHPPVRRFDTDPVAGLDLPCRCRSRV